MIRKIFTAIVFLFSLGIVEATAGDICYDKADEAMTKLHTWHDLRIWFESYPGCDDGYFAEGISDFVVASLAKKWTTLSALNKELINHMAFEDFILKHIDATTDYDDLKVIIHNTKENCPAEFVTLCEKIQSNARAALKDINTNVK